ncbi:MAG TPA: hypothetical protein VGM56_20435 [Byssovorax sp.]|jgi:hypothetical protein
MNSNQVLVSLAALFLASTAALTGCAFEAGIDAEPVVVDGAGSITLEWTVDHRADAFACADAGASAVDVEVFDAFGDNVASRRVDCRDFAATIDLPRGEFDATATLVDDFDDAVSTTATVNRLEVIPGTDLTVDVDFPESSLL